MRVCVCGRCCQNKGKLCFVADLLGQVRYVFRDRWMFAAGLRYPVPSWGMLGIMYVGFPSWGVLGLFKT